MKNLKKISLVLVLALIGTSFIFGAPKALAEPTNAEAKSCANNLKFDDIAHISCTVNGKKFVFLDNVPTDSNTSYSFSNSLSSSEATCQTKSDSLSFSANKNGNFQLTDAGKSFTASVGIYYGQAGKGCQLYSADVTMKGTATDGIKVLLAGTKDGTGITAAKSFGDVAQQQLSNLAFTRLNAGGSDPNKTTALYGSSDFDPTKCTGQILAVYFNGSTSTGATAYDINGSGTMGKFKNLAKVQSSECGVGPVDFGLDNSSTPGSFLLSPAITNITGSLLGNTCTSGQTTPGYDCSCTHDTVGGQSCTLVTSTTTPTPSDPSSGGTGCEAASHTGFEWLVCPILDNLGGFVDSTLSIVDDQLNFNVNTYLANDKGVHTSWVIVKNLVSAMMVIALLVMVISQAIGYGPFDAYTVKKLLPKLVIAIIAMQISWEMAKWLITLADDAGQGLKQIMLAPFGQGGNMDLGTILNHLSGYWALGTTVTGFASLIVVWLGFSEFILPVLLLVGFSVAMSVLTALATIVFRNILIVLLVITFPLALLLWALPGQSFQKYWKMWIDNFTKLLLLFPIMMGLIYGGRIVAWIGGDLGKPGLLDFFTVVVAYFGPLFLLPKAFKWGGSWLSGANNAINNSWPIKKGREAGSSEIKGLLKRRSDQPAKDYTPDDPNFALSRNRFGLPTRLDGNFMKSIRARRFIPTRRSGAVMMQRGDEHNKTEQAIEETYAARAREKATSRQRNIAAGKEKSLGMIKEALDKIGVDPNDKRAQRIGKAGITDLIKTSSFLELAMMKIPGTDTYVWQTDLWRDTVAPSSELYSQVGRSRPDWKPHRLPSGLPKYRGEWQDGERERVANTERETALREGETDESVIQERVTKVVQKRENDYDRRRADKDIQYASALSDVTEEMDSRDLQGIHPVFFDRVGKMAQDAQQYKGVDDYKYKELMKPAENLREMFQNLAAGGGGYQLSTIMGAPEISNMVNFALKLTGDGSTITQIAQSGVGGPGSVVAPAAQTAAPTLTAAPEATAAPAPSPAPTPNPSGSTEPSRRTEHTNPAPAPTTMRLDDETVGKIGRKFGESAGRAINPSLEDLNKTLQNLHHGITGQTPPPNPPNPADDDDDKNPPGGGA